ncbi:diguanylate cyclase (GGDEF) domain-containing protein [Gracilibacillus orientalis]|uniref:Diguanylate cyclase (GGDEF) domain-containing protein n=1 Tax=Gracilibacillus orientalis TaxID=334253 RepID=A0A1I4GSS3_9BACI|nr:sensor domain-containing diguanylate cyclase [Gracilibacillus orientalis]SFL33064.1 diguanylate cyclase (GGDEF) domain-containing protein [Gracilibacillus orientalis]
MEEKVVQDLLELVNQSFEDKKLYLGKTTDETFSIVKMLGNDGSQQEAFRNFTMDLKESFCQLIYLGEQKSLIINDISKHPVTSELALTAKANVGSYMGVPVFYKDGEMFGTLCVVGAETGSFSERDKETLEKFSRLFSYVLELERLASIDSLTNLHNRHYLYENFPKMKNKKAVMLLDLDNFKEVNDTYGHDVGDLVLKEVASRINKQIESNDILARVGGDEFAIVITKENNKTLEDIANDIIDVLSEWSNFPVTVLISASIGICMINEDNATNIHIALKKADTAMYEAKRKGKSTFIFGTD